MSCHDRLETLNDFVDGALAPREALAFEQHLLACAECRAEVEALRSLLDRAAALPRHIDPPADLWQALSARMQGRGAGWRSWPAAAAAILVLGAVGIASTLWNGPPERAGRPDLTVVMPASTRADLPPDLREAEEEFRQATVKLLAALERRKPQLAPETITVLEENLRIINQAIASTGAALQDDPANARLGRMLTAMYATKLDLLQKAARLPGPA